MNKYIKLVISIFAALSIAGASLGQTYNNGQTVYLKANFNELLGASSQMVIKLNNNQNVSLSSVNGASLLGSFVVPANQDIPDLAVDSIVSISVLDTSGHAQLSYDLPKTPGAFLIAENSPIVRNLGDIENISLGGNYIKINVGTNPYGISPPVTINGVKYIYVACQGGHIVTKVNTSSNSAVTTYLVGSEPYGINTVTINSVPFIYVANTGSDTVSVINCLTGAISTINVGVKPYYVTVIGINVYVTNSLSNDVSVIDANTNTVTARLPVATYPRSLTSHQGDLYVTNYGDVNYGGGNSVSVVSSSTNLPITTITLPLNCVGPRGIALARSHWLFVTNYLSNNVTLINPLYNQVFPTSQDGQTTVPSTLPVGRGPRGIIAANSVNKVYVENFDEGTISIIDSLSFTVVGKVNVGNAPSGMSLVDNNLYISSFQDNCLYILDITTNTVKKMYSYGQNGIQYDFFYGYEFDRIAQTTVFDDYGQVIRSISFDINGNIQDLIVEQGTLDIADANINNLEISGEISFNPLTPEEESFYSPNYHLTLAPSNNIYMNSKLEPKIKVNIPAFR